jgi:hypothetical protein
MDVYKHWSVLDHIPDGWVVDRYAGSPLHGHVFVTNGKNLLSGQQLRALAPDPERELKLKALTDELIDKQSL